MRTASCCEAARSTAASGPESGRGLRAALDSRRLLQPGDVGADLLVPRAGDEPGANRVLRRIEGDRPLGSFLRDLEDVVAQAGLDHVARLARLERERGMVDGGRCLTARQPAGVAPAARLRAVGVLARQIRERLAPARLLQD